MFYEPAKSNHGLPHDPFKALVVPRPISWIGSYSVDRQSNLAPYSFFNAVSSSPPIICFSSQNYKDSVANIDQTGAFSHNVTTWDLQDAMNASSAGVARDVNEFDLANLTEKKCELVDAPYVGEAPVVMECVHLETKKLADRHGNQTDCYLVFGEVVGIRIDESVIRDGMVDPRLLRPIARMGYMDYSLEDNPFTLKRP